LRKRSNVSVIRCTARKHAPRLQWFEGVHHGLESDSLAMVMETLVKAEVHRLVITDKDKRVCGIVSLSDILTHLVLEHSRQTTTACSCPRSGSGPTGKRACTRAHTHTHSCRLEQHLIVTRGHLRAHGRRVSHIQLIIVNYYHHRTIAETRGAGLTKTVRCILVWHLRHAIINTHPHDKSVIAPIWLTYTRFTYSPLLTPPFMVHTPLARLLLYCSRAHTYVSIINEEYMCVVDGLPPPHPTLVAMCPIWRS
jgi:hypothetical protein